MSVKIYKQLEILEYGYQLHEAPSKPGSAADLLKKVKQAAQRNGLDPALKALADQLKDSFDKKLAARVQTLESIFGHWLTSILKSILCMNSKQEKVHAQYEKIQKIFPAQELFQEALEKNSLLLASFLKKSFHLDLDQKDEKGNTLLHQWILRGNKEAARLLLQLGANPNALGEGDKPPLHRAIEKYRTPEKQQLTLQFVQLLLEFKADVNLVYHQGYTPLLVAVTVEALDLAGLLIDAGAKMNPERINPENRLVVTPLNEALASRNGVMMKLLLEKGADARGKSQDIEGATSPILFQAFTIKRVDLIRLLLDHGANVEDCDSRGHPPLYAVLKLLQKGQRAQVVNLLLDKGAKIEQQNSKGKTMVQSKKLKDDPELMALLAKRGIQLPAKAS